MCNLQSDEPRGVDSNQSVENDSFELPLQHMPSRMIGNEVREVVPLQTLEGPHI